MPGKNGPTGRVGPLPKIPGECKIRFTSAARKARALRKLGVSADQVASATQITPLLKGARGGLKAVLGSMRFSKDPVVGRFLAKHDGLGVWERQNTPWEAIALAAGVDLPYLLGAALLARRDDATTRAQLLAICRAPELMKKRIEYAKLPGGWRDRDALEKLVLGLP
jgi:hypothetical protein